MLRRSAAKPAKTVVEYSECAWMGLTLGLAWQFFNSVAKCISAGAVFHFSLTLNNPLDHSRVTTDKHNHGLVVGEMEGGGLLNWHSKRLG